MLDSYTDLINSQLLYIATVSDDQTPHLIVVSAAQVINTHTHTHTSGEILIADVQMQQTKSNLLKRPTICLMSLDPKTQTGIKIIGTAQYFTTGKYFDLVKKTADSAYPPKGAVLVTAQKIIVVE